MSGSANTILIEPADGQRRINERLTAGIILPGMLIEKVSAAQTIVAHSTAGGPAQRTFALENVANAEGIADAYASGETARFLYAQPGDLINAALAASAAAIVIGDLLESSGDGYVRKIIPVADLTDSSGGSADDTIAAITNAANAGSADVGPTADAIADLAAKVNALLPTALYNIVGVAIEAVDNSSGGAGTRIQMEVF